MRCLTCGTALLFSLTLVAPAGAGRPKPALQAGKGAVVPQRNVPPPRYVPPPAPPVMPGLTPQQIYNLQLLQRALVDAANRGPHLVTVNQDYNIESDDDLTVRLLQPKRKYDDKGHIVAYTKDELKQLKGLDPNLPGYTGEYDNLKNGQVVKVFLARNKAAKPADKDAGKEKDPDKPEAKSAALAGVLAGTVTRLENSTKKFTLRVTGVGLSGVSRPEQAKDALQGYHAYLILILSRD